MKHECYSVGFEILGSYTGGYEECYDIKPCSPLKFSRRFGGTYRLHLQDRLSIRFHSGSLLGLFDPEDEGDIFFRNVR
jgi:hypothetical protein